MPAPAYRAYTVIKREGKEDYWLNLGIVFAHEDGDGFNLLLQAMPLDGKIVLRTYKEDLRRLGGASPEKRRAALAQKYGKK